MSSGFDFRLLRNSSDGASSGPRIVFFHHAGGSAAPYLALASHLPGEWSVDAVRLTRGSERADRLVSGLAQEAFRSPERGVIFFGHSMGAILAYHVMRHAVVVGEARGPILLVVSSSAAPSSISSQVGTDPSATFWELLYDMIYLGGFSREHAKDEAVVRYAVECYRADLHLLTELRKLPVETVNVPIQYIGGESDASVPRRASEDWSGLSSLFLGVRHFDGGHFFFVDAMRETASAISSAWMRASQSHLDDGHTTSA